MKTLPRLARFAALIGAPVAIALTIYAGRHNPSLLLIALFAVWTFAPFVAALWALAKRPRAAIAVATLVVSLASLAIYADAAFGHPRAKLGFIFLVVPFASLVIVAAVFLSASASRR
jgi:hypothetical protein